MVIIIVLLAFAGWLVHRGIDLGAVVTATIALSAAAAELIGRIPGWSTPTLSTSPGGTGRAGAIEKSQ